MGLPKLSPMAQLAWPNTSPRPNQQWAQSSTPSCFMSPPPSSNSTSGILGHAPTQGGAAYLTTHTTQAPSLSQIQHAGYISTTLSNAFNTMTLVDLSDAGWYRDSSATAHITVESGTLNSISSSYYCWQWFASPCYCFLSYFFSQ